MKNLQREGSSNTCPPCITSTARMAALEQAERCVKWLKEQGFEVLAAQEGPRNPRITIRPSPLCKRLEGAVHRYERTGKIEKHYWVALRFDCEVRWMDGGAA